KGRPEKFARSNRSFEKKGNKPAAKTNVKAVQNKEQQGLQTFNSRLLQHLKNSPGKKFPRKSIYSKFIRDFSKQEMGMGISELEKEGKIVIDGSRVYLPH